MKIRILKIVLAIFSILTLNLESLQAQEVDYFALAKSEYELGHYSVALKAVMKSQYDSKFKNNPEVHFLRGKIEFFFYDIQTDQEQKSIRKQRAISAFERCIEKDENEDYTEDCKKYLDILENDPNYIKRITKDTFSIENYAALIDQKRYEEAGAYFGKYLKGKVLVNEQLMYLEVRSNFELDKIKYGPNLELLEAYNTPSRIYLEELINMDGAYCAKAEAYRDSIDHLEMVWKQHVDLKLDRIVKLVKNENDSLVGQSWIDLIETNAKILMSEYKGDLGFMYKSWGNAYAQLAFNNSIAEPKFEACFLAINAFQEAIHLEATCKECDVKIKELKALNTKWNKETSSEGDNTDLVNQMFLSFQSDDLTKALEKSNASIQIDSLRFRAKTWYLRGYVLKGIWRDIRLKLMLENDSLRYAAIDAYFKTYELDTIGDLSNDAMKSVRYLANTVYNDAVIKYNEHDVKEGRRLYEYHEKIIKLTDPDRDFTERRMEFASYEASIRSQILENNVEYDTVAANLIDSIYTSILKLDPTNVSADYNLKTHRINDGVRRRAFLAALEKENELTKALSDRRRTQLISISAGLLLILILLAVALRAYRQKRKDNDFITAQKAEVEEAHEQLSEKNQEILDSINYAKRIQTAILPPSKLVKEYLHESFILYKPKDVVAGDFYWMESVGDVVYFAAADCTGHGVPGAMVSVICVNGLNRSVREFGLRTPAEILDKTRELVIKEFEKSEEEVKDGMDISLCALNTKTNELQWAGANNPLWIVTERESLESPLEASAELGRSGGGPEGRGVFLHEIKANKQPIGKYGLETPFTNHSIQLEKGDTIYIFSDGYPDQFGGENGKKYKSGNFKKTLVRISTETIEKQKQMLDQEFETWRGTLEQIDDVCVIGVKV